MNAQAHWDRIYKEKAPDQVSAGESTLVDDLLGRGYSKVTVLDISQRAIAAS